MYIFFVHEKSDLMILVTVRQCFYSGTA